MRNYEIIELENIQISSIDNVWIRPVVMQVRLPCIKMITTHFEYLVTGYIETMPYHAKKHYKLQNSASRIRMK